MVVRVLELLLTLLSIGLVLNFMKQKFETENEELKKVKLISSPDVQTTQEVKDEDLALDPKNSQALVPDNQKTWYCLDGYILHFELR